MALLPILKYPDVKLKKVAEQVADDEFEGLQSLIDDMFETLYDDDGVGLAATQVNVQKHIAAIDMGDDNAQKLVFANAEIVHKEGSETSYEGCLSVPGIYEKVTRAEKITVKAQDRFGKPFEMSVDGRLAVCIQHELDHLNGILFIDHLPKLKRKMIQRKLEKLAKKRY